MCVCVRHVYINMFTSFYMDFSCLGADQLDLYQADTCINDLTVKHIPW
jgi:hypothetical protein